MFLCQLQQLTYRMPCLTSRNLEHHPKPINLLVQGDIWQAYEEASAFGQGIYTRGGPRGACMLYFVPSLSAAQLHLTPPSSSQPVNGSQDPQVGLSEWRCLCRALMDPGVAVCVLHKLFIALALLEFGPAV